MNDQCQVGPPQPIAPREFVEQRLPDGGLAVPAWSDVFVDRAGDVHLSSYFISPARLGADEAAPRDVAQLSRRCVAWLSWVVCGDLPATVDSPITALDPLTGQTIWSFSGGRQQIAEFTLPGAEFFTARLAVLNENELLVLYESRTLVNGADRRVRTFAMVVLDRQGQALRSLFIDDPVFALEDHPHSYGVATDAQSNIYLAFSPSGVDNPATALEETTFFSYSPSLQLRWRVHEPGLRGGELAVANGLLFQEREAVARSTSTGLPSFTAAMPGPGARVIGARRALFADGQRVTALDTTSRTGAWVASTQGQLGELSPVTLAQWQSPWGPRDVALLFTTQGADPWLEAIELDTGARAFSCPVSLPELPLMASATGDGLVVMTRSDPQADACLTCDPRFARTRNRFFRLALPGLQRSGAPWSGAWGNEGHTHHEGR